MTLERTAARTGQTVTAVILMILAVRSAQAADAFPLVAQAISVRKSLCFAARQDILLSPPSTGSHTRKPNLVRIVVDELQGGPWTRMTYRLPAEAGGRVVVDNGQSMRQWEQSRHLILLESSREEPTAARRRMLRLLRRNYRCVMLSPALINGFPCDTIRISPCLGHAGPTRRLWIERGRRAILRSEEFDGNGCLRYLSFFETFRYIRRPVPSRFTLPADVPVCRVRQNLRGQPSFRAAFAAAEILGRLPAWLPPGYALISCAACGSPAVRRSVLLRYGDGLEMLSVLETPAGTPPPPARDGHQVWSRDLPALHVAVLGDDTLPGGLGQDMITALDPRTEAALKMGIARTFGPSALTMAARLRRHGWGYDRIAALCLGRRLRGTPAQLQRRAVRWIALTLGNRLDRSR